MRGTAVALGLLASAGCVGRAAPPSVEAQLEAAVAALGEGRVELAGETIARARAQDPLHIAAAQWSSVMAELLWRDDEAVLEQTAAVRNARVAGVDAATNADLRGRLGDLLFQVGRWGECSLPLAVGATGDAARRRGAFAAISHGLPFVRKLTGPLLTEQRLLPGDAPEFVCAANGRQRPFAIDTGTSVTTVARSLADELEVRDRRQAGTAVDGAGHDLPVEVGVLPQFAVGDVEVGSIPALIVDDASLGLGDLHGGPERVPRGVLGLDLLAAFRLTLDAERQSVVLELPRGLPEGESVQCVRAEGRCLVPVFIEGQRLWFVLDTGASHSSLTPAGVTAVPGGAERATPSYRRVRTVGGTIVAVREVRDLVLRTGEARFLGVTLPVVPRGAPGLFPVHGVLGVDLLSRCTVTLDRGRASLRALR